MEPTQTSLKISGVSSQKKLLYIVCFAVFLVVLTIVLLLITKHPTQEEGLYTSPNILFLTQPVNSFYGTIGKISGNTVTVSQQYNSPRPTKLIYEVVITKNTQFFSGSVFDQKKDLTVNDLRVGQKVTVLTAVDLRTLRNSSFEASSINLSSDINIGSNKLAPSSSMSLPQNSTASAKSK
jgi:hypothetical protein